MRKHLKLAVFFSITTLVILGLYGSCQNPFSNNLGSKVDVEPPTIRVESPKTGALLGGSVRFEGVATAYRDLRSVEVRIFYPDPEEGGDPWTGPALDWTSAGVTLIGSATEKNWIFDLDTSGLPEGTLRIRFRARDPSLTTETSELIYNVKNGASTVKLMVPDQESLDDPAKTPQLRVGSELRGQVIDRRGIKPEYPKIKIWLASDTEPMQETDWEQLFLSGIDNFAAGIWTTVDRDNMPVVRPIANFVFPLGTRGPGTYHFRIKTSDVYFYSEDIKDEDGNILHQQGYPRDPEDGEEEIVAFHPNMSGDAYEFRIISPTSELPRIELYTTGIPAAELAEPSIYITDRNSRKIAVDGARDNFRLRILASHSRSIASAALYCEDFAGPLAWDISAGEDIGSGTIFQFTANGNSLFTASPEPYTLRVTVEATDGSTTSQTFTLYLDKDGPAVSILSVQGALEQLGSVAEHSDSAAGVTIIDTPYTVNGNIQVMVDRSANFGIQQAKWIIEDYREMSAVKSDSDSIYSQLMRFRADPTAAGWQFFNGITETGNSGLVETVNRTNAFKFSTGSDRELWLYVIAQDNLHNLGFIMQKIVVNNDSDIPQIIVPGLADTTEIADADALKLTVGADRTITGDRRNVLERDQGIELNFTDDDGINRSEGITIALENLSDSTTRTIDIMNPSPMLQDPRAVGNVGKNWSGVLSQQRMAQAFGRTTMPDGMYRMTITVEDDVDSKVAIGGAVPAAVSAVREFFFAVHTAAPEITIVSPDENSLQRDQLVSINGTVRSRLDVQRLFIQYYPDIIDLTGNANNRNSEWIEIVLPSGTVSDGEYIYNWTTSVNFNPDGLNPLDDLRSFTLEAYDSLGYRNTRSRTVQVDSTPPEVELFEFNFGRLPSAGVYYVNGKVPFTITAWDLNGIKITDDLVHIKWFVLPASSPIPVWSTIPGANEAGGQFERSNSIGGGRYQAIFDSRDLTDGVVYILYAIAEDNADNYNIAEILRTFTVLQSSDEPVIESLSPINGQFRTNVGLSISGIAIDDDGFIAARAGEYVEIRFNGSGAWVPVPGTLDPTGEISFALAFESADFTTDSGRFGSYFNNDGIKQYQIRVTDEADNKSGIAAVTKIFPGDSTYYNFVLKTNAPSSTFGSNLPSRPRVSSQAELLAFLAGGSVADTHLETVSVLVNGIRMVTLYDETTSHGTYANDEFEWDLTGLPADWLAVEGKPLFGGAPEDRYDDGLITITIEAIDEAGNIARYPWAFYKDTKGPNISYNVDRIFLPDTSPLPLANIIRGNAGSVFLTGRFEDDYSNIRAANAAEYRFNDTGAWFPVSFTILENPRMARWSILIPGNAAYPDEPGYGPPSAANLPDGEHTIAIRVWDEHDNENIESGLRFIVDRRAPVLPLPEDIAVVVGTTDMGSLLEYARVFSADGLRHDSDEPVFTLKGTVRDHNLTRLHIAIYADDKETTAVYLEWDSNDPDSRLNITSAGNAYEWNWELEIQEQDLYALRNSSEVQALPPAEIDSNRYRIRISASDMALRDSPVRNWYFYLDDNEPDLVFFNLEPVEARPPVFESNDISLTGSAYDINRIREIKYRIAKYDYTVGAWRYRSNTAWTETAPVEWSVLVPANAATARRDVNWTLDRNNLSSTSSGRYPADLFAAEGQYRLELEVTDWSLGQGAGNAVEERRVFFVDRFDPVIDWGNTEPFYRNNADGEVIISFTASDANIIDENIVAVIQRPNGAGNYTIPASQIALGPIDFDSNPPGRLVTLRPVMAEGTTPWNAGAYTLVLTVKDMAGKTASAFETLNFILDNTPPAITVLPGSSTEAITGQVTLRGRFIKDRAISPVSRVAFYVAHNGNAFGPPAGYQSLSINTGTINDDAFDADLDQWFIDNAGWYFNTGSGSPSSLEINGNPAVTIDQGLATANITIPNLRFLNGTNYLRPWVTGDPDVTYKGVTLGAGDVSQLVIYILAVDTAGNRLVHKYDYWVYPEGDRPVITSVINPDKTKIEEMRLLNGRIRISGTAADNIRVKNVYFRVIDDATDTPVTALRIPQWNSSWGALEEMQSPITIDPSTYLGITGHRAGNGGWFIANGGSSTNVPWWAFINTEGELDPEGSGARKITIEILVEDTIWDDVNGRWGGGWNGAGWDAPSAVNFFSSVEVVTAYVVKDAPEFADEIVLSNRSYTTLNGGLVAGTVIGNRTYRPDMIDFEAWKPMPPASMRKRASYAISVRNDSGVRAITYAGVNLLDPAELYNSTTYWTDLGRVDAGTFGIAVMAGPKALRLPGTLSDLGRDVGGDRGKTFLVWDPGNDGIHYTKFVYDGGTLPFTSASARLMEERFDNLGQLFFEWVIVADVNTEAGALNYTNTSILHPLSFSVTDYTEPVPLISTRPVSLRIDNLPPQIMYTHSSNIAGTSATFGGVAGDSGVVNGLEKVVLWFSREVDVPDVGRAERSVTWVRDNTFMPGTGPEGITLPTGVTFPFIPDENTSVSNWSCIVIDRNDPMGTQTRYGHRRPIGYATVGGVLSQSWYVTLDSTALESGRVTAHVLVYDTAGNVNYINQRLMILNDIPRISHITLGTDILGTADNGSATIATLGDGVSEEIVIDTRTLNTYNVVYDEAFNVRNGLLAMKVETSQAIVDKPRNFRVEYVSNATEIILDETTYQRIRAGKVYIINNPGHLNPGPEEYRFPWGSFGMPGETPRRGLAFMAIEDGDNPTLDIPEGDYGNPSVWELNSSYYNLSGDITSISNPHGGGVTNNRLLRTLPSALALPDIHYLTSAGAAASSAEFAYRTGAFGTAAGTTIIDFAPILNTDGRPGDYPGTGNPWINHSLFIVKVFDGPEYELFGDFALLSIRVNNDDKTKPYAQLYDLNPGTEGQYTALTGTTPAARQAAALQPVMGENRTRGGLWNENSVREVVKSGHIEPRKGTSLSNIQMGGALTEAQATIFRPVADPDYFFDADTVSGEVILRGYAEDDQRIGRIDLRFSDVPADTVTILTSDGAATNMVIPPAMTGRVRFAEEIELDRHRVEWAYLWDTQALPVNTVVGDITVSVIAYNANTAPAASEGMAQAGAVVDTYNYFNPDFPNELKRYNQIAVEIRPYITGFKRNKTDFAHDTRSRQGRYLLARGEGVVVSGFNLGGAGTTATAINLPGASADPAPAAVTATQVTNFVLSSDNAARYRFFTVPAAAVSGTGLVTLTVTRGAHTYAAVNTIADRLDEDDRPVLQPWNTERSPGIDGSDLWDDYTMVHIWQSNDNTATGTGVDINRGRFTVTMQTTHGGQPFNIGYPAMSINPLNGQLWSSHIEGGSSPTSQNTGVNLISNNFNAGTPPTRVAEFIDPFRYSDIYVNERGEQFTAFSIIGQASNAQSNLTWAQLGGLYVHGPNGANPALTSGMGATTSHYYVESAYYNASANPPGAFATPKPTDQFKNPRIVTHRFSADQNDEHIHVSYYDSKDGAMKYAYNRRGLPGVINATTAPRRWINLDGGFDADDRETPAMTFTLQQANNGIGTGNIGTAGNRQVRQVHVANGAEVTQGDLIYTFGSGTNTNLTLIYAPISGTITGLLAPSGTNQALTVNVFTITSLNDRVVNYTERNNVSVSNRPNAGYHSAIAVTHEGYPVIAYYDQTNQILKMAISNSERPTVANDWNIVDNVIPEGNLNRVGTGEFVSMRIDTVNGADIAHITALNAIDGNLVYISGEIDTDARTFVFDTVQVVDSVGSVGSRAEISLDKDGNPWIAYLDRSRVGARDGVKVAFLNEDVFYKDDRDIYGVSVAGWENMHIPTMYRVEDARFGMENFPTRNITATGAARFWKGAVGYLSQDYYRIAYYVE